MTSGSVDPQHPLQTAADQARQAAAAAGVVVTQLSTAQQAMDAAELLHRIWNPDGQGETPMEPGLLVALEHAGNYVGGAYAGDELIGVTVGFFGPPQASLMHSHIAGVAAHAVGTGVGAAMKLDQRTWCLQRGVRTMEWTFDPLIARNAGFNLNRLGARFTEYLPHFYGEMRDGTNAGQGSDRALITWDLLQMAPRSSAEPELVLLRPGDDDAPLRYAQGNDIAEAAGAAGVVGLQIPADIPAMRQSQPELSAQWRTALRETMHPLMQTGWQVHGIRNSTYLLVR